MTKTNTAKETFHCVKFLSYRSTFTSSTLSLTKMSSLFPPFFPRPFPQFYPPTLVHESRHPRRDDTPRCAHADPHLSPRMTSPVVELLRRDKYTLGVGHEAFSNGRTKLPLVNNNHRRVSLSRIVRSARLLLDPRRREKLRATFGDENIGSKSLFLFESSSTSPMN